MSDTPLPRRPLDQAAWPLVLLALGLGDLLAAPSAREAAPVVLPPSAQGGCAAGPAAWNARRLRALPGIGPARALALQRAVWSERWTDRSLLLSDVSGIGPHTALRVRADLEARGLDPGCPATPPGEVELLCRHTRLARRPPAGS